MPPKTSDVKPEVHDAELEPVADETAQQARRVAIGYAETEAEAADLIRMLGIEREPLRPE